MPPKTRLQAKKLQTEKSPEQAAVARTRGSKRPAATVQAAAYSSEAEGDAIDSFPSKPKRAAVARGRASTTSTTKKEPSTKATTTKKEPPTKAPTTSPPKRPSTRASTTSTTKNEASTIDTTTFTNKKEPTTRTTTTSTKKKPPTRATTASTNKKEPSSKATTTSTTKKEASSRASTTSTSKKEPSTRSTTTSTTKKKAPSKPPTTSTTKKEPSTRAKASSTTKKEPSTRASRRTRASKKGKKEEQPTSQEETEPAKVADEKGEEVVDQVKEAGDAQAAEVTREDQQVHLLEKVDEESESLVETIEKPSGVEILPTVVDVIESIKDQVEKTVEDIQDLTQDEEALDESVMNKNEDSPKSTPADTRDSLEVHVDSNSVLNLTEDDKSIDQEKPVQEESAKEISISGMENEKTIGPGIDQDPTQECEMKNGKPEMNNSENEVFNASGVINNSNDNNFNDTTVVYDISQNETLPSSEFNDKTGEIIKRKSDDLDDDSLITAKKLIKKPRVRLLEVPELPSISGKVMAFGDDMCGELGLKDTGNNKRKPVFLKDIDEPVAYIASGGMHNVCLTADGQIYTWGCNDEGALGRDTSKPIEGRSDTLEAEPMKVPFPVKIVKVSAGDSHSAALTSTGEVYIWGNFKDNNGKIGLICESKEGQLQPIKIDIPDTTFVDIASGNDHLLLLADTGDIYSLGVGEQGQLGRIPKEDGKLIKENRKLFLKPHLVKFDDDSIVCDRIWAGQYSSFARSKSGQIYAWGLNNYCQLGTPNDSKEDLIVPFPIRVPAFSKIDGVIEQICAGTHFTLARDSKGRVYSFGRHEYGRLGHGEIKSSIEEPKMIEALKNEFIKHIATGSVTSFAVSDKGHLYSWGMSSNALGHGEEDLDVWTPRRIESKHLETNKVIYVAAGSQHTVIVVQTDSN